jgi:hypothetical protein
VAVSISGVECAQVRQLTAGISDPWQIHCATHQRHWYHSDLSLMRVSGTLRVMKRRGMLSDELAWNDEKDRIDASGMPLLPVPGTKPPANDPTNKPAPAKVA